MFRKGKILLVIGIILMCSSFYFSSIDNSAATMLTRVIGGICVVVDYVMFRHPDSQQAE